MSPHLGRDFSSWQGILSDADCEGIDFAYVKATGPNGYQNPYAPQQCAILRKHGVAVGYYHFFDPAAAVADQLQTFYFMVSSLGPTTLPFAIDMEVADNAGWPDLASKAMDFIQTIEGWHLYIPNPRSLVYVNLNFYDSLAGFPWGRWVWLADPNPGAPHKPCLILQGAPRPVSGTDPKSVDPDTFIGNDLEWLAFVGYQAPAVPPGPPENTVPGPDGLQLVVIGQMNGGGWYTGREASGGVAVYAGLGNPTQWHTGQDLQLLPAGTPLAVALADAGHIGSTVSTVQL